MKIFLWNEMVRCGGEQFVETACWRLYEADFFIYFLNPKKSDYSRKNTAAQWLTFY